MAPESVCGVARVHARKGEREGGAGEHRGGIWGNTAKQRRVSNAAAAQAPARQNTRHQALIAFVCISSRLPCITPGVRVPGRVAP